MNGFHSGTDLENLHVNYLSIKIKVDEGIPQWGRFGKLEGEYCQNGMHNLKLKHHSELGNLVGYLIYTINLDLYLYYLTR